MMDGFATGSTQEVNAAIGAAVPDIICVDFFDTLVFRTCGAPEGIFFQTATHADLCGRAPPDWPRLRLAAEHALMAACRSGEVRFDDIYEAIGDRAALAPDLLKALQQAEIATELANWVPNHSLIAALAAAQAGGASVLIVSDTYLPGALLDSFIRPHLVPDEVITSADCQMTKRRGEVFRHLAKRHSGKSLLHIGDNPRADGNAARHGLAFCHYDDPRSIMAHLPPEVRKAARRMGRGAIDYSQVHAQLAAIPAPVAALAYAWSIVAYQMMLDLHAHAKAIGADEIWFLSRDGESLYPIYARIFGSEAIRANYVQVSRRALAPISTLPPEAEEHRLCRQYLRECLNPQTRSLMMVDIGWQGGMQAKLRKALPESVDLSGYYFSISPRAERRLHPRTAKLFDWDDGAYVQATTEFLFGFLERTCIGYQASAQGVVPVRGGDERDCSDKDYTAAFRAFLDLWAQSPREALARHDILAIVRRVQMFPRSREMRAIADWHFASDPDGGNVVVVGNPRLGKVKSLFWLFSKENLWPMANLAIKFDNRVLIFGVQTLYSRFLSARSWLQRRRHKVPKLPD